MNIPNLKEVAWFSPPDMGGENTSSIMRRYMELLGWKVGYDNPSIIYVGSESQIEKGAEIKEKFPWVPLILNFWGWMPDRFLYSDWRQHYQRKLEIMNRTATTIIVPNNEVVNQLKMLGIGIKVEIRHPGVDTIGLMRGKIESRKYIKSAPFIVSVGRIVPHKRFDLVIDALEGLDIKYAIIGKGEEEENLLKLAKYLNVDLAISKDADDLHKAELLSLARAVIVPSAFEGFGLPIVEAATVRTPVIASSLPVFKELFGDDLEYFEGPEELRSKIKMILENEMYRKNIITKESILALKYSAFPQSMELDKMFAETISNVLKDSMKQEIDHGNNTQADAYNLDALLDSEFFKYRLDPNTELFWFRVEPLIKNLTGKTVLDVGSSTGVFSVHMASKGYEVTSIDIAKEYLKIVENLADKVKVRERIKTKVCNALEIEKHFEANSFDNVWTGEIIEHFEDSSLLIRGLMKVLKPGGHFLLTVPYSNACYDPFHLREFPNEESIKAIFKEFPKFEFKEIKPIGSPGGKHNNWFAWGIKRD